MQPGVLFDTATLQAGAKIVLAAALCHGCISDIRRLRLPNSVWLIVLAAFFFNYWLLGARQDLMPHFQVGAIAFACTFGIYLLIGGFGAGDVKLISALVFWGGPRDGLAFVFIMTLIGGLFALLLLALGKSMARWPAIEAFIPSRRVKAWARRRIFPLGVPICVAGLICIPSFFAP
jgi:prepilin peptidase CpaA